MTLGAAMQRVQHSIRPALDVLIREIQNLPDPDDILGEVLTILDQADSLLCEYEYIHSDDQALVDDDGA